MVYQNNQDKTRQKNDLQREMIMKEGDYKKIMGKKYKIKHIVSGKYI